MSDLRYDNYVTKLMYSEIAKTKPISRELEKQLFIDLRTADSNKRQKIIEILVQSNMRFVLKYVMRYKKKMAVDINELVSEGKMGLLKAIDCFDYNMDIKFISFAVWYVKAYVSKYLERRDMIRLPSHQRVKLTKMRQTIDVNDFDSECTYLNQLTNELVSLDIKINDDIDDNTLSSFISDDSSLDFFDELDDQYRYKLLDDALQRILTKDEYLVLVHSYGILGKYKATYRDINAMIGKSNESIRKLKDSALTKIKKHHEIINIFNDSID